VDVGTGDSIGYDEDRHEARPGDLEGVGVRRCIEPLEVRGRGRGGGRVTVVEGGSSTIEGVGWKGFWRWIGVGASSSTDALKPWS
jgi:hypothetical protein